MNAMQQAMMSSIPKDTKFPKFDGSKVKPVSVQAKPHVIISIQSSGDGAIIKARKITREVIDVISANGDEFMLRDSCGEVWKAERVTNLVYRARS